MTAETLNQVINQIVKLREYEEPLRKYFKNLDERDEFRQELHLTICQMPLPKLLTLWNNGQFKWFYLSIIKNQVASNSSTWHINFRKRKQKELFFEDAPAFQVNNIKQEEDYFETEEYYIEKQQLNIQSIKRIYEIIEEQLKLNPKLIVHFTLFKMHFFQKMSFQQISDKMKIKYNTVFQYVKKGKNLIIQEFNKCK